MRLCVLHNLYFYNHMMEESEMLLMQETSQNIRKCGWKALKREKLTRKDNLYIK